MGLGVLEESEATGEFRIVEMVTLRLVLKQICGLH